MNEFRKYRTKVLKEFRPYIPGEILDVGVSISKADADNGSPKAGDMIGRNPNNVNDQWLVAADFFDANYELA